MKRILFVIFGMAGPLLVIWGILSAVLPVSLAAAQTSMVVDTLEDELNSDGDCSLREAIEAANGNTAVLCSETR